MSTTIKILVCILAGAGAGLGTGFAGMSAAAVISPMLTTILGMDPYLAVGIALASDVLASAASAVMYARKKNIDIKNGIVMMISVLIYTFVGSFAASYLPSKAMGGFSMIMTFFLGLRFIIKPVTKPKARLENATKKQKIIRSIVCGGTVGFICGFVGAGGGLMMLLVLTSVLGYELKTAVGTSVFIMSATALTGAVSHFAIGGAPDMLSLIVCVISTLVFAMIASHIANKVSSKTANRATGIVLVVLGISLVIIKYL